MYVRSSTKHSTNRLLIVTWKASNDVTSIYDCTWLLSKQWITGASEKEGCEWEEWRKESVGGAGTDLDLDHPGTAWWIRLLLLLLVVVVRYESLRRGRVLQHEINHITTTRTVKGWSTICRLKQLTSSSSIRSTETAVCTNETNKNMWRCHHITSAQN